jgi:predicted nucleic acid-binding Zn ribbon protein
MPVPEDEKFCSPECEKAFNDKRKKDSRKMLVFYLGAAIVFMIIGFMITGF